MNSQIKKLNMECVDEYAMNACIIFKNNKEIVEKLENMGYKKSMIFSDDISNIWIIGSRIYNSSFDKEYFETFYQYKEGDYDNLYGYYCGENEKMFFELAHKVVK